MKSAGIIFSGAGAMALMIAYHSIPFLIVRGGIDSPAQFRPFLLSAWLAVAVVGFYQMWRAEHWARRPRTSALPYSCFQ